MSVMEVNSIDEINKGDVLVDFYTPTCGPCRTMYPLVEEIAREYNGLKVAKVDVTQNPEISQMFAVMSVPTLVYLRNSRVKETRGFSNKNQIKAMVESCLKA